MVIYQNKDPIYGRIFDAVEMSMGIIYAIPPSQCGWPERERPPSVPASPPSNVHMHVVYAA